MFKNNPEVAALSSCLGQTYPQSECAAGIPLAAVLSVVSSSSIFSQATKNASLSLHPRWRTTEKHFIGLSIKLSVQLDVKMEQIVLKQTH